METKSKRNSSLILTIQFCFSLLEAVPMDPNAENINVTISVNGPSQTFPAVSIKKGETLLKVLQTLQSNSNFRQVYTCIYVCVCFRYIQYYILTL